MTATAATRTWTAPRRIGYDASAAATADRVLPMLAEQRVVWLSTVRPDGTPHLCPTWFWWDGEALVVYAKPDAVKVRNLLANPRLMIAVGQAEDDFAVGLIEAAAVVGTEPAVVPDAFFAKYADDLGPGRLDPATFRTLYTREIRITPTRFLAWRGRGAGSGEGAGGPAVPAARRPDVAPRRVGLAARVAAGLDRIADRLRGGTLGPIGASA